MKKPTKFFIRSIWVTLATCYLLILLGAVVRATGSGLGCPDWPLCFGRWVPPLHISELPENYREAFTIGGRPIAPFSAFKTWTEYLNRLLGAVVGLQVTGIMAMALWSRSFIGLSVSLFVLVGVQGLLGSRVVSSHLASSLVTLHMLLAMGVLFLLLELSLRAPRVLGKLPPATSRKGLRMPIGDGLGAIDFGHSGEGTD